MKYINIIFSISFIFLSGCVTTQKTWEATGGSKTDGIVQISYELGQFERGESSEQQGLEAATARCKMWGYTKAEPLGSEKNKCNTMGQYNCLQTREC